MPEPQLAGPVSGLFDNGDGPPGHCSDGFLHRGYVLLKIHPESPFLTFVASFVCSVRDPGCI